MGDGSPGRALEQGADQLYAHGEALIRAERSFLGTAKEAFDITSATVGILTLFVAALAAPPVAVPLAVGAGVEMVMVEAAHACVTWCDVADCGRAARREPPRSSSRT